MKKSMVGCLGLLWLLSVQAQNPLSVYPTHWWVGMKNSNVQLMLHIPGIGKSSHFSVSYPGVHLQKVFFPENTNYVFLDLKIDPATQPGIVKIQTTLTGSFQQIPWELKRRRTGNGKTYAQGVRSEDLIYLLMPDRFSNGDSTNDRISGLKDQSLNRKEIFDRHGGDLQGVLNHLDYLKNLGVTALWMTPVWENDMPNRTEHGYACTEHYRVDPRLGGDEWYRKVSDALHQRGMKLIQDVVYNHVGLQHFTVQDPPMKDWLHQWPSFTQPNYKEQTLFDPHAAEADRQKMVNGWFTREMPDLNQSNPYVANFLIQHAIWSVEEFGIDGWRIDTYIYLDPVFANRCNQALLDEYPRITMFGEAWVQSVVNEAFFTRNNLKIPFKSNAVGVTDFVALFGGIQPALKNPPEGVQQLYQTLSNDLLYENPLNNVIFLDNHDMTRIYSEVGEDPARLKMGIGWLLTERGIPQLYYGTEIMMAGIKNPDGWVRLDFPGGWPGDLKNGFTGNGLSLEERSLQEYTRTLANFRKTSSALKSGKLMQFVPELGVYAYFRYDERQTIFCVMNSTAEAQSLNLERFSEKLKGFANGREVTNGQYYTLSKPISLPPESLIILELEK